MKEAEFITELIDYVRTLAYTNQLDLCCQDTVALIADCLQSRYENMGKI